MRLGPNLWDDPNYVLGTIRPRAAGLDLGDAAVPFRKLYVAEEIDVGTLIPDEITFSEAAALNPSGARIMVDTVTGNDVGYLVFGAAGGSTTSARTANMTLYGIDAPTNPGQADFGSARLAGAQVIIEGRGGIINFRTPDVVGQSQRERFRIDINGDLLSEATYGGNLIFQRPTSGIVFASGANGRIGTFTLTGATPVVVPNTSLAASDQIILSRDTIGGTPGPFELTSRTNGTSFTVTGTAGDTSTVRYILVRTI